MRFRVGETEDIFESRPLRTVENKFYVNVGPGKIYTSGLEHVNYPDPDKAAELNPDERDFYHEEIGYHPWEETSIEEQILELYRHVGSWFGADPNSFQWLDSQLESAGNDREMEFKLKKLVKAGYMKTQEIEGETVYFPEAKLADEEMRCP